MASPPDNSAMLKRQAAQLMSAQSEKGFLENRGQMLGTDGKPVPFVLFKTEAPGLNIYITERGLTYSFLKFEEDRHGTEGETDHSVLPGIEEHEEEGRYEWTWNW